MRVPIIEARVIKINRKIASLTELKNSMNDFIFTDLNPKFFEKLKNRISKFQYLKYNIFQDDIEASKVYEHYDGILMVMLLHHIEWKKGIDSILRLKPSKLYFIIQEQKEGVAWTKERPCSIYKKIFRNS